MRVEGGCNWGEVNDALQPFGLAATGGFVSVTGVAGLTLGGGLGWLVRKHGLALDNLLSARVVLADGRLVTASARENDDLFWAIRGGGGNFGVVTSFEFKVHPVGTVLAGIVLHPAGNARAAISRWRDLEASAPDELTQGALLFHFPDDPSAPEAMRGAAVVGLGGVYAGAPEDGEKILRPLREYGPPLVDAFEAMAYNKAQRMADFLWPSGLHGYWKSSYLTGLSSRRPDRRRLRHASLRGSKDRRESETGGRLASVRPARRPRGRATVRLRRARCRLDGERCPRARCRRGAP